MIAYLLISNGLAVAVLWWFLADLSAPVRVVSGAVLIGAIVVLLVAVGRRVRRVHSEFESYPPQVIRHDGGGERRCHHKSGEDPEFFVNDSW